ncbi:MAG: hypothetical protein HYR96_04635 [Deltaproteobacteria bacterium]|nr:hypothetical protein [Deltaproteobacteria bacterium]MBI3293519.1 hypothetical protein [Deltaproteobacteria bacterium]
MRFGILAFVSMAVGLQAFGAFQFTCTENTWWVENRGAFLKKGEVVTAEVNLDKVTLSFSTMTPKKVVAERDHRFQTGYRYIDSDTNFTKSDNGQTGVFVSSKIVKHTLEAGKAARISITTNEANDSDSDIEEGAKGPDFLWTTATRLDCKSK